MQTSRRETFKHLPLYYCKMDLLFLLINYTYMVHDKTIKTIEPTK